MRVRPPFRFDLVVLSFVCSLVVVGCPSHSVLEPIKPPLRTAKDALVASTYSEPLIVDWQPADRGRLEVSMRQGVAVVKYDGNSLELLKDCRVAGTYGFLGTTRKEQLVRLEDTDEIQANLPLSGLGLASRLSSEFARGSVLDVALVWVGQLRTTFTQVDETQLEGNCLGATHFVRGAMVGAFGMQTSSRAEVQTVAKIFSAGVEGSSQSQKSVRVLEGDPLDCRQASPDAERPPPQCSVPIRLELSALALEVDHRSAAPTVDLPNVCPRNWVRKDGKCTRPKPSVSHQCRTEDVADCKTECERNDAASCVNYGFALERGAGTNRDVTTAAAQYRNACRLGLGLGCHNLGYLYANGLGVARDEKKAVELYRQACNEGEPRGCNSLGAAYFSGQGITKDLSLSHRWLLAACNGGLGEACANLGSLLLTAGLDRAKAASQLFQRACDAPSGQGCAALAGSYEFGLGVSKDLKRAMSLSQRACSLGNALGCVSTASYYAAGKGVSPNEERARTLFEETCEHGELLACALLKTAYHESRELKPAEIRLYAETWEPTCRAGFVGDCTSLGILYLGSNRAEEGATLLRQSCTAGDTFACWVQQRR